MPAIPFIYLLATSRTFEESSYCDVHCSCDSSNVAWTHFFCLGLEITMRCHTREERSKWKASVRSSFNALTLMPWSNYTWGSLWFVFEAAEDCYFSEDSPKAVPFGTLNLDIHCTEGRDFDVRQRYLGGPNPLPTFGSICRQKFLTKNLVGRNSQRPILSLDRSTQRPKSP